MSAASKTPGTASGRRHLPAFWSIHATNAWLCPQRNKISAMLHRNNVPSKPDCKEVRSPASAHLIKADKSAGSRFDVTPGHQFLTVTV